MKKSAFTPQDKAFLITLAKSVDLLNGGQKAIVHNIVAAHNRLNKIEAQLNQPTKNTQHGMAAEFTALMPGFTKENTQTEFFFESLKKLMKECNVRRLEGRIDA